MTINLISWDLSIQFKSLNLSHKLFDSLANVGRKTIKRESTRLSRVMNTEKFEFSNRVK